MKPARKMTDREFADLIADAKGRHNLSEIVSRHTSLKKRGARELVGLCPFHQERSPSFEVNDSKGTYHCHGCGVGGDAISFLTKLEGMTFRAAVETLLGEAFPTISPAERARRKAEDEAAARHRVEYARSVWARTEMSAGTPAETYARSRALTAPLPPTVRFVRAPRWVDYDTGEAGREFPAVCCAIQAVDGQVTGVQMIFLNRDGTGKWEGRGKAKLSFGLLAGSALRLGPVRDEVIAVEGPEDGLTLRQEMPDQSIWVACGTALLPRIEWPDNVRSICFAGDNNAAGREAVANAAAIQRAAGRGVRTIFPAADFKDWNDQLRGIRT